MQAKAQEKLQCTKPQGVPAWTFPGAAKPQQKTFNVQRSTFNVQGLTACSKTSCSPREGTRPTIFPRESACVVGPVPSPGGFFNGLLGIPPGSAKIRQDHVRRIVSGCPGDVA